MITCIDTNNIDTSYSSRQKSCSVLMTYSMQYFTSKGIATTDEGQVPPTPRDQHSSGPYTWNILHTKLLLNTFFLNSIMELVKSNHNYNLTIIIRLTEMLIVLKIWHTNQGAKSLHVFRFLRLFVLIKCILHTCIYVALYVISLLLTTMWHAYFTEYCYVLM